MSIDITNQPFTAKFSVFFEFTMPAVMTPADFMSMTKLSKW
ncbi:MAG: hypothetical protein ACTHK1_06265 [Actinomycetales bacterium]